MSTTTDVEFGTSIQPVPIRPKEPEKLLVTLRSLSTSFTEIVDEIYSEKEKVPIVIQRLQKSLDGAVGQGKLRSEQCAIHSLECIHGNTTLSLIQHWAFWRPEPLQPTTDRILLHSSQVGDRPKRNLRELFRSTSNWPTAFLLVACILEWKVEDPKRFLQKELWPSSGRFPYRRLPMLGADIQLPSLRHTVESNVVSLEWFRDTPKFLTFWGLLENGSHNYYARRPDVTYCNIYFNSKAQLHTDGLFVFSNQGSLEEFTGKIGATEPDGASFGLVVLKQLFRQVVENGAVFLQVFSREIYTAKYDGLRHPGRTNIEFLLLAEEYLSEMPGVLNTAVETIEGLSKAMRINPDDFRNWYTEKSSEDVLYLISRSKELSAEVKCAKETSIYHEH
ncbi:hypothetical protein K440DRAFT_657358 [Wilcoxina mikolae CBS 423.85]|nr:hypothetical protein K440DRAFT_657358 [Wilcoxina mikolae CBS 423.85]